MNRMEVASAYQSSADYAENKEQANAYQALSNAFKSNASPEAISDLEDSAYKVGCSSLYQVGFDIDGNCVA